MDKSPSDSVTFNTLDQKLIQLTGVVGRMQAFLAETRSAAIPTTVYEGVSAVASALSQVHKKVVTLEEERQSLRALAQVGQVVNSSLELDNVLKIVMDTIIRITGAERGFLMLRNEQDEMVVQTARNWEQENLDTDTVATSRTIINRVVNEGQPLLTTNAQEDPRFTGQDSVVALNLRSILCAPLIVKGQAIGVIYADNRVRSGIFTPKELDLISAFANQAAVAIENARLFESVRRTLVEVMELKDLMDHVFSSIPSGVMTADVQRKITLCNRAAEQILGTESRLVVGNSLDEVLVQATPELENYLQRVMERNEQITDLEARPVIGQRGQLDLRFSLSPLKDENLVTQGVAIVMDDLTERKRLEAQKRLFERMVSPAVIEQIDPDSIEMGGSRAEISVMFADIRGFTSFSERVQPEGLVSVLNRYLALAAESVLNEGGTIDKFLGDAVMAWFNAPVLQPDHTLRAVRSALTICNSLGFLHSELHPSVRLSFGVGIHVGEAVLGLVGTQKRLEYTAIGDSVNTAKRIQENARAGQVLLSAEAYERVKDSVEAVKIDPIQAKGKSEPVVVYEVTGLRPQAG